MGAKVQLKRWDDTNTLFTIEHVEIDSIQLW